MSYVIVHPTIDRSKAAHEQAEPYLYAGVAAERDNGIFIRGAQMLGTGSVMSDFVFVTVILLLKPGDEDYAISCAVPNSAPVGRAGIGVWLTPTSIRDVLRRRAGSHPGARVSHLRLAGGRSAGRSLSCEL